MAMRIPKVRYADADGVSIAYEVRGDGPYDVVRISGVFPSIVGRAIVPIFRHGDETFTAFSRTIVLDRRGTGMSDPLSDGSIPPLEQQVADVAAVMDDAGSERAVIWGAADGGQVAMLFAAMYPERTTALVLTSAFARWFRSEDHPFGPPEEKREHLADVVRRYWGDPDNPWGIMIAAPSRQDDPAFREQYAFVQSISASRAAAAATFFAPGNDIRAVLPLIQARTLIVFPAETPFGVERADHLAALIPNSTVATFPGRDMLESPDVIGMIEEFVTGAPPAPVDERVLATVMFTDIVGSTDRLAVVGDHSWRKVLDRHDAMVRDCLADHRGREVDTAGDGFFAVFDGPARAIRCARAVVDGARRLGIDVRAGVHTGECEVRGSGYAGIAVHIGARIAALGSSGEILASRTVKDLIAGSGIELKDHGTHELKGIPEPWQVFSVVER
jgi:class 3 adenylate cyclase/pimeloyl-ACP methyl ester carboxylesterase